MKTKLALALLVITAVLVPQLPAVAQGMRGMFGGGMFGGPMAAAYLGLTQDQQSQLKTLMSSQRATTQPLMKQLSTYEQTLRQMTQTTTPLNTAQLQALANQMAQVQAQLTVARAQTEWQFFNNILTSDQQAKLVALQQQMQQMRQNRENNQTPNPSPNQ